MKDLVVKIFTLLFIVSFIIAIPVSIIKGHIEDMTLDATYMNKADHDIKLKFTKDIAKSEDFHLAFLYVDGDEYRGRYKFEMGKKLGKYITMYFNEYPKSEESDYSTTLHMTLKYNKRKLTVVESYGVDTDNEGSPFAPNQIFAKRTWWHIWGKKLCIILIAAFIIWLLRIPEFIVNKKYREKSINDFKESKKEYDKEKENIQKDYEEEVSGYTELMREGVDDFKNEMKNVKEGVNEMKDSLKKGLEEYKKSKKKD